MRRVLVALLLTLAGAGLATTVALAAHAPRYSGGPVHTGPTGATGPVGATGTTGPTAATGTDAPVPVGYPKISGEITPGHIVTATAGSWAGLVPLSYAYQWERCHLSAPCVAIPGATAASFRISTADISDFLEVVVTATNADGSAQAPSDKDGPVWSSRPTRAEIRSDLLPLAMQYAGAQSALLHRGVPEQYDFPAPAHLAVTWTVARCPQKAGSACHVGMKLAAAHAVDVAAGPRYVVIRRVAGTVALLRLNRRIGVRVAATYRLASDGRSYSRVSRISLPGHHFTGSFFG